MIGRQRPPSPPRASQETGLEMSPAHPRCTLYTMGAAIGAAALKRSVRSAMSSMPPEG
jgi:hypothetical protein